MKRDRLLRIWVEDAFYLWWIHESRSKRISYAELLRRMKTLYERYAHTIPK